MSFWNDFDLFFSDPFFSTPMLPRRSLLLTDNHNRRHAGSQQLSARDSEKGAVVELEVPRFRKEHIQVHVDAARGLITVEGNRAPAGGDNGQQGGHTHVASSTMSSFRRTFSASPELFNLNDVSWNVEDGLLTMTIPRQVERPKTIAPSDVKGTDVHINSIAAPPAAAAVAGGSSGSEGQVATTGGSRSSTDFLWPPRMEVAKAPEAGVAVSYQYTLPAGTKPEEVSIKVMDNGNLKVLVGHRVRNETDHGFEEHTASFTRYFPLPAGTKADQVRASLEGDRLKINIAESATPQAKQ